MGSENDWSMQLEIAHVLFMDIVGYSRLPMEDQTRALSDLQDLVRGSREFRRADGRGDLLRLPTGDGMALVFFRDPVAPVQCAVQLARALREHPNLPLRMGLHSGPVYRVEDINANINVSGGGINLAQRVMDCGDAGHILVSAALRELLGQVGAWPLHDLGEFQVKHGQRLHLYSLYTDDFGNPEVPAKMRARAGTSQRPGTPREVTGHVAILYKRGAQPDESILALLESQLGAQGFPVFIDRHLAIGVEWAKSIEQQVRTAGAVVPLLSEASIHSEMLSYEIQLAHEASQVQGNPRLLPIRIGYEGPLPEPMAGILDPLQYALWQGPADNDRLLAEVLRALRNPQAAPAAPVRLEPVGGAVPLDSRLYVVRPTDDEFREAIARRDSIVLVKGARQMGKTSLLARGLQQAREAKASVVFTDLQKLNTSQLEGVAELLFALAESIADQLDLDTMPSDVWDYNRAPNVNFERFLRREVLRKLPHPLVWGIDEADRLFTCPFGSEVFGLFRSWHNERALNPSGPWSRLTLAIAYATEAHLFITDMNQSPFNVGTRLVVSDFTMAQVADLNRRHGSPLCDDSEVARFFNLVGGQPYLVRRGLQEMAARGLGLDAFEGQADQEEGLYGDHLRRILVLLARDPELMDVVRGILQGQPCPTPESFYRLRSAGVMAGDSPRAVWPRCRLYVTYLERHLL